MPLVAPGTHAVDLSWRLPEGSPGLIDRGPVIDGDEKQRGDDDRTSGDERKNLERSEHDSTFRHRRRGLNRERVPHTEAAGAARRLCAEGSGVKGQNPGGRESYSSPQPWHLRMYSPDLMKDVDVVPQLGQGDFAIPSGHPSASTLITRWING